MGSRTNRAIDLVIDKKLQTSFIVKSSKNQLLKFSNYCAVRKYDAIRHAGLISDLVGVNSIIAERDLYDNEVCNFLDYRVAKSQSRFNLLRLFKPGEILSTVISG